MDTTDALFDDDIITDELLDRDYRDIDADTANAVVVRNTTMLQQLREFERTTMDYAMRFRGALHLGQPADQPAEDDDDCNVPFQQAIEYARFGHNGVTPIPEGQQDRANGYDDPLTEQVIFPTLMEYFCEDAVKHMFYTNTHELAEQFQVEDYEDLHDVFWQKIDKANIASIHQTYRVVSGAAANNAAREQVDRVVGLMDYYLGVYYEEFFHALAGWIHRVRYVLTYQNAVARRIVGRP